MSSTTIGDLREKIRHRSGRRSYSRSRSRSYSPPPPPSHPSRMKSSSKRMTESTIARYSKSMSVSSRKQRSRSKSGTRRKRSRSRSGTRRKKSRSKSKTRSKRNSDASSSRTSSALPKKKSKKRARSTSSSDSNDEVLMKVRRKIQEQLSAMDKIEEDVRSMSKMRKRKKSKSGERKRHKSSTKEKKDDSDDDLNNSTTSSVTRKRNKSSTDQKSPDYQPPSPAFIPPPSPIVAKAYFKPKPEAADQLLAGYAKCKVCKSYFPDEEESRKQHLAQHQDRVFLVSLPSDSYYYDIEDAITHLILKLGIQRLDLQEKCKKNNLIQNPSNLRGFSCDICQVLDTNNEEAFMRHMKDECKIKDRLERLQHLICFCRGCQGKFDNKEELDQHIAAGGCWPSAMTINRLCDTAADNRTAAGAGPADIAQLLKIKQEKIDHDRAVQIKQEKLDMQQFGSVKSRQGSARAANPIIPNANLVLQNFPRVQMSSNTPGSEPEAEPFNAYSQPPSSQSSQQDFSLPPPSILQSMNPSVTDLQTILNNIPVLQNFPPQFSVPPPNFPEPPPVRVPPPNCDNTAPPRQHSVDSKESIRLLSLNKGKSSDNFLAPSPNKNNRMRRDSASIEEPSPRYSPLRLSPNIVPSPRAPLPSTDDLFQDDLGSVRSLSRTSNRSVSRTSNRSRSSADGVDIISEQNIVRIVSAAACARLTCQWSDPHVDTCRRKQIQDRCAGKKCSWADLHANTCERLNFYCNGTKLGENNYRWYSPEDLKEVKIIPLQVPDGSVPDRSCQERPSVVMRLIYRRTSKMLQDPRRSQRVYPTVDPEPGRSFTIRARRGKGWPVTVTISTWSGLSMVTVSNKPNRHLEQIDSDHDSDIECID